MVAGIAVSNYREAAKEEPPKVVAKGPCVVLGKKKCHIVADAVRGFYDTQNDEIHYLHVSFVGMGGALNHTYKNITVQDFYPAWLQAKTWKPKGSE